MRTPALASIALLAACGGSPAGSEVCTPGSCGAGRACVVERCRPADASPTPADSQRLLLPPSDLAVLASRDVVAGEAALPDVIALGREATGGLVVLLRFTPTWRADADVLSAFVVLEPAKSAPPATGPITVEVARVLEPWTSTTATWGRQPRLDLPELGAVVRPRTPRPLRIDVTALVHAWARHRDDDHGLALLAGATDPFGSAYATGAGDGTGPRLEVYLR